MASREKKQNRKKPESHHYFGRATAGAACRWCGDCKGCSYLYDLPHFHGGLSETGCLIDRATFYLNCAERESAAVDALLEQLKSNLEAAVGGMSAEQLRWHPDGKWCALQILEHLYLSYTGTTKGFQRMLENGKSAASRGSMWQWTRAAFVFSFNYLPSGREAPTSTRPRGLPEEKVRSEIWEKLAAMDAIITEAQARFGRTARLFDHPFLGPLNGAQWRRFHLLHGMHHRRQILRLRDDMPQSKSS